jgi:hypothetical protein
MMRSILLLAGCLVVLMPGLHSGPALAGEGTGDRPMAIVTDCSYTAGLNETSETALALALYCAKQEAVAMSADRLTNEGLLRGDADRKMEIFCLVADDLQPELLEKSVDDQTRTYTVKIKSSLSLTDFVKAGIRNDTLEKEETNFSLKEELEPVVDPAISPALELSRAYRYIRNRHWRMAIIYMDHLEKKYPRWGVLYMAKAAAYLGLHEQQRAILALTSACDLGVKDACLKIHALDSPE